MKEQSNKIENFKIVRTIWKNSFDKILEIKVINNREKEDYKEKVLNDLKSKTREKFNKKFNDEETEYRRELSEIRNSNHLMTVQERHNMVNALKEECRLKLVKLAKSQSADYKAFLKSIIIECMTKLLEDRLVVRVRKEDVTLAKGLVSECQKSYKEIMKNATGRDYETELQIDENKYLEESDMLLFN